MPNFQINEPLKLNPTQINKDAESEWLVEFKLEDEDELNDLFSHEDYEKYITAE